MFVPSFGPAWGIQPSKSQNYSLFHADETVGSNFAELGSPASRPCHHPEGEHASHSEKKYAGDFPRPAFNTCHFGSATQSITLVFQQGMDLDVPSVVGGRLASQMPA